MTRMVRALVVSRNFKREFVLKLANRERNIPIAIENAPEAPASGRFFRSLTKTLFKSFFCVFFRGLNLILGEVFKG